MILTDDFVALNNPKTGSTFVRTVLNKIYGEPQRNDVVEKLKIVFGIKKPVLTELLLPSNRNFKSKRNQHGTYSQIPRSHVGKPVFSVVRNPYEKLLAAYEYQYWTRTPRLSKRMLLDHFPMFPKLSIDEYIDMITMADEEFSINEKGLSIGSQTEQFIFMFFKNPVQVVKEIDSKYFESKEYLNDIGNVEFLMQENLNIQLADYLSRFNISSSKLEIIKHHQKVNENKTRQKNKNVLMTDKFYNYLEINEKYLFIMLREFGIHYERPNNIENC